MTPPPASPAFSALPLSASLLPSPCVIPDHFGFERTLARPLLAPPAQLACVVRLEDGGGGVPEGSRAPATRAEGSRTGWMGPTGEDYEALGRLRTRRVEWGKGGESEMHEHDWMRLLTCYDPWSQPPMRDRVFTPGMLDGVWEGRWLVHFLLVIKRRSINLDS
jgi:hypothetical protein